MSQPTAMKLIVPDDSGSSTPAKESGALTLIPAINGTVYYYEGNLKSSKIELASEKDIRNIIINKKRKTAEKDLVVIIKPSKASVYKDVVNILDEMTINDVKRYALVDITKEEEDLLK